MRLASFAPYAVALLTACGAKLGDPSSAATSPPDAPSGGGTIDAPASGDATVIDAAPDAPPDARPCTGSAADGHCFLYHSDQVTWAQAGSACAADGTHLAIITNVVQDNAILGLVGTVTPAYIGATDSVTEGTFLWVDGTPLTFVNFDAGEPNNGGNPSTHEEDCLVIRGDTGGKWDDRPCLPEGVSTPGVYPYVCEF
jgi:hypothetical protein